MSIYKGMYRVFAISAVLGSGFIAFAFLGFFDLLPLGIAANKAAPDHSHGPWINALLMFQFGLQHSLMARSWFKQWSSRWVSPVIERSLYVWASNLSLGLLIYGWQGMPGFLWQLEGLWRPVMMIVAVSGTFLVAVSAKKIGGGDLLGLNQVRAFLRNQQPKKACFMTPGPYAWVRHPIQLGILGVFWCWPDMSLGRAFFCAGMTLYIYVGLIFEERDLRAEFGAAYQSYCRRVPMLLPIWPLARRRD